MRLDEKVKSRITVAQYYGTYIEPGVNLDEEDETSRPCKLHGEKSGTSFSYSKEKKICSCFGKCHMLRADVIGLHQRWHNLKSREEATQSLADILNVKADKIELIREKPKYNRFVVDKSVYLNRAESLAKDIDTCIELDYLMSQLKTDGEVIEDLKSFIERHGG